MNCDSVILHDYKHNDSCPPGKHAHRCTNEATYVIRTKDNRIRHWCSAHTANGSRWGNHMEHTRISRCPACGQTFLSERAVNEHFRTCEAKNT